MLRCPLSLIKAVVVSIGLFLFVKLKLCVIWDQYNVPAYVQSSLALNQGRLDFLVPEGSIDKVVVMTRMKYEDVRWVEENLPDWQTAIYSINDPSSAFQTPANKGRESMAYLTYVIDHYDSLPAIIAFLHPHLDGFWRAWHVDTPHHSNLDSLNHLQLDHVKQAGYVNLRCNWNPGCLQTHQENHYITPRIWQAMFGAEEKPELIGAACCAQFAVSKEQVRRRPKTDYIRYRKWVLDTELSDAMSGRVMEFLWHIIFGQKAVHCPDVKSCYCKVYKHCEVFES